MTPRMTDISHFRQPYKNAVFSGFGGADDALVTRDYRSVKTLVPAAGLALMAGLFTAMSFVVLTTAADKEQVVLTPVTGALPIPATSWINQELAKGRDVIVSTNDPGGLAAIVGGKLAPGSQIVLASVSVADDEVPAAVGPGAALVTASKLAPGGASEATKAGMGSSLAVAAVALLVVGGVYYVFGRKKHARDGGR